MLFWWFFFLVIALCFSAPALSLSPSKPIPPSQQSQQPFQVRTYLIRNQHHTFNTHFSKSDSFEKQLVISVNILHNITNVLTAVQCVKLAIFPASFQTFQRLLVSCCKTKMLTGRGLLRDSSDNKGGFDTLNLHTSPPEHLIYCVCLGAMK